MFDFQSYVLFYLFAGIDKPQKEYLMPKPARRNLCLQDILLYTYKQKGIIRFMENL